MATKRAELRTGVEKAMITKEYAKELFRYDQNTGALHWKKSRSGAKKSGVAGSADAKGYIICTVNGKRYKAHRLIWLMAYGEFPPDQIDHINQIKNDNRISNLRSVDTRTNMKNAKLYSSNTWGVAGVYWYKNDKKWIADIKADGVRRYLGTYFDFFEAVCARKTAEVRYNFHPNHGLAKAI